MSPEEASAIIRRIVKHEEGVWRSQHFTDMLEERGYTIADVWKLLRSGTIEGLPIRTYGTATIECVSLDAVWMAEKRDLS